jgi:hypothetical protein
MPSASGSIIDSQFVYVSSQVTIYSLSDTISYNDFEEEFLTAAVALLARIEAHEFHTELIFKFHH